MLSQLLRSLMQKITGKLAAPIAPSPPAVAQDPIAVSKAPAPSASNSNKQQPEILPQPPVIPSSHWKAHETASFCDQLCQTIAWTRKLSTDFDPGNGSQREVFRQINPLINGIPLYRFEDDQACWQVDDLDEAVYHQALAAAIATRGNIYHRPQSRLSDEGRILVFQTRVSTQDGCAMAESQCFVDESDVPPIDTWFYLKHGYYIQEPGSTALFCWIPIAFVPVMQKAINVEILGSYSWLDESNPILYNNICKHIEPGENRYDTIAYFLHWNDQEIGLYHITNPDMSYLTGEWLDNQSPAAVEFRQIMSRFETTTFYKDIHKAEKLILVADNARPPQIHCLAVDLNGSQLTVQMVLNPQRIALFFPED